MVPGVIHDWELYNLLCDTILANGMYFAAATICNQSMKSKDDVGINLDVINEAVTFTAKACAHGT